MSLSIPLLLALTGGGAAPAFDPLSLSPHLWLDPSDLTTLFQDSAMTTPVTADGDPVGAILDKSGNNLHLTQATAGSRPLYQTSDGLHWLEFDGVDDWLEHGAVGISQPLELGIAARFLSSTGLRIVGIDGQQIYRDGTLNLYAGTVMAGTTLPSNGTDFVATARFNGASSRIAVDNGSYSTGNAGIGNLEFRNQIGADQGSSDYVNCRIYGVLAAPALSDDEIALLRTYLAAKQGREL
jgi:hypothetical protein